MKNNLPVIFGLGAYILISIYVNHVTIHELKRDLREQQILREVDQERLRNVKEDYEAKLARCNRNIDVTH